MKDRYHLDSLNMVYYLLMNHYYFIIHIDHYLPVFIDQNNHFDNSFNLSIHLHYFELRIRFDCTFIQDETYLLVIEPLTYL